MKLSLNLPTDRVDRAADFITGPGIAEMAQAAEAAGFDSVAVTDHPFPDDAWMRGGGHHALDPMVALAFAAAATTTLRVRTNLYVAAYRNPFLSAKAIGSLDLLSGGRVILGIGAGYLEPEFRALGVAFEARNELTDESIVAMRRAWNEEGVELRGQAFEATGNTMLPHPVQRPGPPIWIGGNSRRAIRRAVDLGDGWLPFPNTSATVRRRRTPRMETLDDLRAGVDFARAYAAEADRRAPVGVSFPLGGIDVGATSSPPGSTAAAVETAERLAAAGVTDLSTGVRRVDSRAEFLAEVRRMGEELVPAIAAVEAGKGIVA